jgi:hypothetical protein
MAGRPTLGGQEPNPHTLEEGKCRRWRQHLEFRRASTRSYPPGHGHVYKAYPRLRRGLGGWGCWGLASSGALGRFLAVWDRMCSSINLWPCRLQTGATLAAAADAWPRLQTLAS